LSDYVPVRCPYCGERGEVNIDDDGWSRQQFVQDCPVCCQPWEVEVTRDAEGDWSAVVRTSDE
jgi:sarcosine oxidase delta subunit